MWSTRPPKDIKSNQPTKTMTPYRAAFVIQNAWRRFEDDRRSQAYEAHIADLNATYYAQCYTRTYTDSSDDEW